MEAEKQQNSGSIENFAREQAKNDLGCWEPMGLFLKGAGSMGHPHAEDHYLVCFSIRS